MHHWPETNESLILRVKDPADADSWSDFLAIYRPVVIRMACGRGLQHADADEIQSEFTEVTWTLFWLTSIEGVSVAEVARRQNKTPGAVYMNRFRVMQQLKEKVFEVSEVWSDVK